MASSGGEGVEGWEVGGDCTITLNSAGIKTFFPIFSSDLSIFLNYNFNKLNTICKIALLNVCSVCPHGQMKYTEV